MLKQFDPKNEKQPATLKVFISKMLNSLTDS